MHPGTGTVPPWGRDGAAAEASRQTSALWHSSLTPISCSRPWPRSDLVPTSCCSPVAVVARFGGAGESGQAGEGERAVMGGERDRGDGAVARSPLHGRSTIVGRERERGKKGIRGRDENTELRDLFPRLYTPSDGEWVKGEHGWEHGRGAGKPRPSSIESLGPLF